MKLSEYLLKINELAKYKPELLDCDIVWVGEDGSVHDVDHFAEHGLLNSNCLRGEFVCHDETDILEDEEIKDFNQTVVCIN